MSPKELSYQYLYKVPYGVVAISSLLTGATQVQLPGPHTGCSDSYRKWRSTYTITV